MATLGALLVGLAVRSAVVMATSEEPYTGPPEVVSHLNPAQFDGTTVTTPCFTYRVPDDEVWWLDESSGGCATTVYYGETWDRLTGIVVRAQAGTPPGDDLVGVAGATAQAALLGGLEGAQVDIQHIGGRQVVRLRMVGSLGLAMTAYVVTLPAGRFTQAGQDLTSIWMHGPRAPWSLEAMATIIQSLESPGG